MSLAPGGWKKCRTFLPQRKQRTWRFLRIFVEEHQVYPLIRNISLLFVFSSASPNEINVLLVYYYNLGKGSPVFTLR
jgi:hypothetical protein